MFKNLAAILVSGALIFSNVASAAGAAKQQGALPPGKPATVKQAQWMFVNGQWVWLMAGAFAVAGAGLVSSGDTHGSVVGTTNCTPVPTCTPTTTTTTTSTTTTTTNH